MRILAPLAAGVAALLLATGCGSSGGGSSTPADTTTAATNTTSTAAASGDLTIKMTEFAFTPKDSTAKAGKVTITAPNDGKVTHELVILKTSADPAKLPQKNGEVDESASVGEIADVPAGQTKSKTFKLAPGTYAIICNLPGHYAGGMYGSITVQ